MEKIPFIIIIALFYLCAFHLFCIKNKPFYVFSKGRSFSSTLTSLFIGLCNLWGYLMMMCVLGCFIHYSMTCLHISTANYGDILSISCTFGSYLLCLFMNKIISKYSLEPKKSVIDKTKERLI